MALVKSDTQNDIRVHSTKLREHQHYLLYETTISEHPYLSLGQLLADNDKFNLELPSQPDLPEAWTAESCRILLIRFGTHM